MPRVSLFASIADFAAATAPFRVWASAALPVAPAQEPDPLQLDWTVTDAGDAAGAAAGGGDLSIAQPGPAGVVALWVEAGVAGARRGSLCLPWGVRDPAVRGLLSLGGGTMLRCSVGGDAERIAVRLSTADDSLPPEAEVTVGPVGLFVTGAAGAAGPAVHWPGAGELRTLPAGGVARLDDCLAVLRADRAVLAKLPSLGGDVRVLREFALLDDEMEPLLRGTDAEPLALAPPRPGCRYARIDVRGAMRRRPGEFSSINGLWVRDAVGNSVAAWEAHVGNYGGWEADVDPTSPWTLGVLGTSYDYGEQRWNGWLLTFDEAARTLQWTPTGTPDEGNTPEIVSLVVIAQEVPA